MHLQKDKSNNTMNPYPLIVLMLGDYIPLKISSFCNINIQSLLNDSG